MSRQRGDSLGHLYHQLDGAPGELTEEAGARRDGITNALGQLAERGPVHGMDATDGGTTSLVELSS